MQPGMAQSYVVQVLLLGPDGSLAVITPMLLWPFLATSRLSYQMYRDHCSPSLPAPGRQVITPALEVVPPLNAYRRKELAEQTLRPLIFSPALVFARRLAGRDAFANVPHLGGI